MEPISKIYISVDHLHGIKYEKDWSEDNKQDVKDLIKDAKTMVNDFQEKLIAECERKATTKCTEYQGKVEEGSFKVERINFIFIVTPVCRQAGFDKPYLRQVNSV